ncbi:MAG: TetR/AcrR family transcriptional regulator [Candidatus Dormibacteraeota bacterium]|nr:TetR/AcrR family transcriptional regulator [Candidatus Dormibacteraeota bacterium]
MDSDPADFSVAVVASRASVSRSTLYEAFESRAGLIRALLEDALAAAGYQRLVDLISLPDPREATLQGLAYGCVMYSAQHPVLQRLVLLARLDPEAAELMQKSDQGRADSMRWMAERLAAAGYLKAGTEVAEAAALLWILTSFPTFDQLYSGWGLASKACGNLLTSVARSSLLSA